MQSTRQEQTAFMLRMPLSIKGMLAEQAQKEDRSLNYIINRILREKMEANNAEATPEK